MLQNSCAVWLSLSLSLCACATTDTNPMPTVGHVDLQRFMGAWYVIASIPTPFEKNAYNAVETYALDGGTIATTFTYHKGSFDGPLKTMRPRGFVRDPDNAVWGMQFIWPFKADYRIAHLDAAYSEVVIARRARDYVWIMARKPEISADDYGRLAGIVQGLGYDVAKLRKVPQRWP